MFWIIFGLFCCGVVCGNVVVNVTIYEDIGGVGENFTISNGDTISTKYDALILLIKNQTIPTLKENQIKIENDLSILEITNCRVSEIEPGSLKITPILSVLKINYNSLVQINSGIFNEVKTKVLDLSNNLIATVSPDAFANNSFLQIVKLDYNLIKNIDANWFENSPNVYQLNIIYNDITELPPNSFQHMTKFRPLKLRLSANRISKIDPNALNPFSEIEMLRLNGNKLTAVPGELFQNRTIKNLQINTNELTFFPNELFNLTSMENLEFLENAHFNCDCLKKVKEFVELNNVVVIYPAIICEDRPKEVNIVFNYNKTYEIPLLLSQPT